MITADCLPTTAKKNAPAQCCAASSAAIPTAAKPPTRKHCCRRCSQRELCGAAKRFLRPPPLRHFRSRLGLPLFTAYSQLIHSVFTACSQREVAVRLGGSHCSASRAPTLPISATTLLPLCHATSFCSSSASSCHRVRSADCCPARGKSLGSTIHFTECGRGRSGGVDNRA